MIELTARQMQIINIVQQNAPITGDQIAESLHMSKPTIRADLSLLVMLDYINAKPKVGYFPGGRASSDRRNSYMLQNIQVKDIQEIPIIIREITTVQDAVVTLFLQDVGTLIVCDEHGKLAGVASRKDFLKVTLGNAGAATMPVSLVMTRQPKVVTVKPEDSVLDAANKIIYHQVDSLPVVIPDHDNSNESEVVGRLTKASILKLLLQQENHL